MYKICYTWDESENRLSWGIHDGMIYIKRGFKTRKAAREWCDKNNLVYQK